MALVQTSYLKAKSYWSVAYSHFMVDVLNSSRTLLVAIIAVALGLSNAEVGVAFVLYNVGSALTQPFFGELADRIGPRRPIMYGLGWMVLFFAAAAVVADWPALVALTLAGIGSGAFHPSGTLVASHSSRLRPGQATSIFFMAGQMGLFVGPVLAGMLLDQYGRTSYLLLPFLASLAIVAVARYLTDSDHTHEVHSQTEDSAELPANTARPPDFRRTGTLLTLIILGTSTVSLATINFAPKLFTELGYTAAYVGWLSGLLMLGSAVGGVVGGSLSDRYEAKFIISLSVLAAIAPLMLYIPAQGVARFLLLPLAGFFVGMPHSILVLKIQALFPGRKAMASGLALGFMFFSGSIGTLALGVIADEIGLALALQLVALLLLVAAVAALLLPAEQQRWPAWRGEAS